MAVGRAWGKNRRRHLGVARDTQDSHRFFSYPPSGSRIDGLKLTDL
ncbi:MAG: hypothetical protein Q4G30_08205 [Actinomycetaceae bacterium]|nr:hypothetical protein [Actinomycetaceae bacterium]